MLSEPLVELIHKYGVGNLLTNRILIVDDDQPNLVVLEGLLELDHEVFSATSGEEALNIIKSVHVDVVISDQRMPGMNGVELLSKIKALVPDIAGIILTGYTDSDAIISAINRANVFRFLTKPYKPEEMLDTVSRAFEYVYQIRAIRWLLSELDMRNAQLSKTLQELQATQQEMLHIERLGTIGRLTAGILHELRNFLMGLTIIEEEFNKDLSINPDLRSLVTVSLGGMRNLLHTFETLNQFAKYGAVELKLENISPAEIITDTLAILRLDKEFRTRKINVNIEQNLPDITIDRRKMVQVLVNLIRNAIQATKQGQEITIEAKKYDDQSILFAVEDEGAGVPPEIEGKLFDPFITSKGEKGMGMGLYISRLIVESHQGKIVYKRRPQTGARFEVMLGFPKEEVS